MECRSPHDCESDSNYWTANSNWSKEALDTYNKLKFLTQDENWTQASALHQRNLKVRKLLACTEGRIVTGAFFINPVEKIGKAVVTFQNWSEGPKGYVHGGMVASIHDAMLSTLSNKVKGPCVTGSLDVNYKNSVPLLTTVLLDAKIDKIENRKIFVRCTMTDVEGNIMYSNANALFIKLDAKF